MPELPLREKAGQELANRILMTKKRRKTADKAAGEGGSNNSIGGGVISNVFAANTGFGQTSLERLHSMSPAAQLLATSKLGLAKLADRSLQASYSPMMSPSVRSGGGLGRTPTPQPSLHPLVTPSPSALSSNLTPGTTKQRRTVNLSAATSASSSTTSARRNQSSSSSKKRPNASDFF